MKDAQFQIYTGDGKGKTTAAVGLAVRALGAGNTVYLGQFIKDMEYHELSILHTLPKIVIELYGTGKGCLIEKTPQKLDWQAAAAGYEKALAALQSKKYDLVILDEICIAYYIGLLTQEQLVQLAESRPPETELVFTGRGCPQAVLDMADLVTEMKEDRHYYQEKGLLARDGIER